MKFGVMFIVFLFVVIMSDVEGRLSVESFLDLVSPRHPKVNRVRRIEDAHGDRFAVLDTVGLAEQYGYSAEQHNFTSDDGYNIVIFRVTGGPASPPAKGKPIVFMQHAMLTSSDYWLLMGPEHDLAFMLVDAGYDIWLGNIRGNTYCRSHTNLTTDNKEFWDFSWHDAAVMDVSAAISYALEYSGEKKLSYIGHSMGTTMSFVLLTQRPEYNDKMRLVINLAPTGFWKYESNIFYQLAVQYSTMMKTIFSENLGRYDLLAQSNMYSKLAPMLCSDRSVLQPLCLTVYGMIVGQSIEALNISLIPHYVSYVPAGASVKTLYHFGQCLKTGYLQKYDYGREKNLKLYGTEKPPIYNMSMITAPVALIYGNTDALSTPENVNGLSKLLPNLATCEAVPSPIFNHMDFIIAKSAKDLVYNRILELLSLYSKE